MAAAPQEGNGPARYKFCADTENGWMDANEYHTYGFLWTDEEMTFSIDGVDYYTLDLTKEII